MKRFTLPMTLALALLPFPLAAQPPSLSAPAPVELTLSNGLNVVLADDALSAGVAVAVEYAVGHADDPPSQRGLSHLIEHLTFAARRSCAPSRPMTSSDSSLPDTRRSPPSSAPST
jgi:Insulinase (Peptidase family M16)